MESSRAAFSRRRIALLLAALVLLVAFWPTLRSFHDVWTRYNYSHGYPTAAVVAWLVWRRRDGLWRGSPSGRDVFLMVSGLLSLLWLVGTVTNMRVVHQASLPLIVVAWIGALSGWRSARRLLPAVVVFFFVVPFWEVFIGPLQAMTIRVADIATRVAGIDAAVSGEIITLPAGSLRVAGSCAGLHFFLVGLLLGTLYAHLFLTGWRNRLLVIAGAGFFSVVANWIRVTGLVFLGHWTEMESDLLANHGTYGWVIFFGAFVLFMPLAWYVERRDRDPVDVAPEASPGPDRISAPPGADGTAPRLSRILIATPIALAGPLLILTFAALPTAGTAEYPAAPGDAAWARLSPGPEDGWEWRPDVSNPDTTSVRWWTNGRRAVRFDWIVDHQQEQGEELTGGATAIAAESMLLDDRTRWLRDQDRWVRQAVVRDSEGVVIIWYWYRVGDVEAVSVGWAKVLELWGFFRRRPYAELLAVSTRCREDPCQEELEALASFVEVTFSGRR